MVVVDVQRLSFPVIFLGADRANTALSGEHFRKLLKTEPIESPHSRSQHLRLIRGPPCSVIGETLILVGVIVGQCLCAPPEITSQVGFLAGNFAANLALVASASGFIAIPAKRFERLSFFTDTAPLRSGNWHIQLKQNARHFQPSVCRELRNWSGLICRLWALVCRYLLRRTEHEIGLSFRPSNEGN